MTREEAIQRFNGIINAMSISIAQSKFYPSKAELDELCDMAIEALSAEAVHGEWIKHKGEWINKGDYAECSICGAHTASQFDGVEIIPLKTKFCPNCGAIMVKGGDTE